MAKKDRTGNRKTRDQRKQFKTPELGYYLIVTDTEATERCFFTGLHQAMPEDVRNKLVIKVIETKTRTMIDKCMELMAYDAQYRIPWIVFDRDQVQGFDDIIAEAVNKGIQVGWSNPCFEIWMYAYFGSMPAIQDSWTCCSDFKLVDDICYKLQMLADEKEISFIVGTIYMDEKIYNRAILFQPYKNCQFYDKRALWGWDRDNFTEGQNEGIFEIGGITI